MIIYKKGLKNSRFLVLNIQFGVQNNRSKDFFEILFSLKGSFWGQKESFKTILGPMLGFFYCYYNRLLWSDPNWASVQALAPDRAVAIWKNKAERLIAQVKPSAYQEAAKYLRKAAKVMCRGKKPAEWESYLKKLREQHLRKRRLIEILDGLDGKPIVKKSRWQSEKTREWGQTLILD